MSKPNLKVVRNELKTNRILKPDEPKPLVPPIFDESEEVRINFWRPNLKWLNSLERVDKNR